MDINYYSIIDEVLGHSDERYFGKGYIDTHQKIESYAMSLDNGITKFIGIASVKPSINWSRKNNTNAIPHLSSIDAIEIACFIASLMYSSKYLKLNFSPESIKKIEIYAGSDPIETNLDNLNVNADISFEDISIVNIKIENMKIIIHADLISKGDSFCKDKKPFSINNVIVINNYLSAYAIANSKEFFPDTKWSLTHFFVASLQLGQVLLYQLDNIPRSESNTLWMRKTIIEANSSLSDFNISQPVYTALEKCRELTYNNETWRCADICSVLGNTKITCSVTHKIGAVA
ncbi:Pseudomonas avirulence D protein (AvrD) [Yersinia aldovae]|uniref:AvrD family protein n=1 Tax=Yersinia aldovae TaxID=29483 RepID=UPI0005DF94AF|nr:AvrD family protein [Yersinia aldovae]CNJ84205.1 Pseudomonas avirulence D protein (AvrD) [Yersinia aldovae]